MAKEIQKGWFEFACTIKHITDKAVLVNDGTKDIWLPRSQIEAPDPATLGVGEEVPEMLIPEWLAIEKGLV